MILCRKELILGVIKTFLPFAHFLFTRRILPASSGYFSHYYFIIKKSFKGCIFARGNVNRVKNRVTILLLFVFLCLLVPKAKGQDATFSQFYAAEMYLNPAMVGVEEFLTLGLNYRNQYKVIIDPYVTSQASLVAPIYINERERHLGGIGISAYNDHAGNNTFSSEGILINAAYNLKLSDASTVSFGIQGGLMQKRIDVNGFQWGSQFCLACADNNSGTPPSFDPAISSQTMFPDIGAGVMYYLNSRKDYEDVKGWSAYMGVSAFHLNAPNESLLSNTKNILPMLIKGHGGVEFNLSNRFNLSPNVLVAMQEDYHRC